MNINGMIKWFAVMAGVVAMAVAANAQKKEVAFSNFRDQPPADEDASPLPDERKEYFAGRGPIAKRIAAPVNETWPETGFWLSTNSNARYNRHCENYRKTRGTPAGRPKASPAESAAAERDYFARQRRTTPATMTARARPLRTRFVSWKSFAPSMKVITTENRRRSEHAEIGTSGRASPLK